MSATVEIALAREAFLCAVRSSMLLAVGRRLRDGDTLKEIAARIDKTEAWLRCVLFGEVALTLEIVADIAFACDCQARLSLDAEAP